MAHAWLDSLSEDWVSDQSFSAPAASESAAACNAISASGRPNLYPSAQLAPAKAPAASRIPRLHPEGANRAQTVASHDSNSSNVLSERSVNDINIPLTLSARRRSPSKLSQELRMQCQGSRGRYVSRSISASTLGSVIHNSISYQKSQSVSPAKGAAKGDTPDWRRRLVNGDLSYGEQRDLFTSAGTGLENIFKPPSRHATLTASATNATATATTTADDIPSDDIFLADRVAAHLDSTLPSSPPMYAQREDASTVEIHVDDSVAPEDGFPRQQRRNLYEGIQYRRTGESGDEASREMDQSLPPETLSFVDQTFSLADKDTPSVDQPPAAEPKPAESRVVSGQSVIRNEDFSPILLTRCHDMNGATAFGPAELSPNELRKRLENLCRRGQIVVGNNSTEEISDGSGADRKTSMVYRKLGEFVNLRRGGFSEEGSFQHRLLSSNLNDTSDLLPEESLQASTPKQFPTIREARWERTPETLARSPEVPRAPNPSPSKNTALAPAPAPAPLRNNSRSPLKLFQPYDTFTNQTLLRRLSQFEGDCVSDASPSQLPCRDGDDSLADFSRAQAVSHGDNETARPSAASVGQFGGGQLDGYEFNEDVSCYHTNDASLVDGDKENCAPDGSSVALPRMPVFDVTHDSSPADPEDDLVIYRKRQKGFLAAASFPQRSHLRGASVRSQASLSQLRQSTAVADPDDGAFSTPIMRRDTGSTDAGKRPRPSPSKDPTPKRRRTLHESDIAYSVEDSIQAQSVFDSVRLSHHQMQSALGGGKKHKDMARPQSAAGLPENSWGRQEPPHLGSAIRPSTAGAAVSRSSYSKQTAKSPAAPGVASDAERKPSIRTEDFINEANKIMAMIRNKAGVTSGLASVEESEAEHNAMSQQPLTSPVEDSFEDSTREPFSRPPSREGRPTLPRVPTKQENPELAHLLKKYEEASDMGDIISSSMRSLAMARESIRATQEMTRELESYGTGASIGTWHSNSGSRPSLFDHDEISDPPNIQISRSPPMSTAGDHDGIPSNSSGPSTSRSIHTGSSRGSDTRKTIAPQSISHLIPDQVGNMVLDKQRKLWIRQKSGSFIAASVAGVTSASRNRSAKNTLPSEGSEDDPFADIPDLSVDIVRELQNLRKDATHVPSPLAQGAVLPTSAGLSRPPNHVGAAAMKSALANGGSALLSSVPGSSNSSPTRSPPDKGPASPAKGDDDVEHEIRLHEDRVTSTSKRKNLTITFSSPIASIIQDAPYSAGVSDTTGSEDQSPIQQPPGSAMADRLWGSLSRPASRGRMAKTRAPSSAIPRGNFQGGSAGRPRNVTRGPERHLSVRGRTFVARPVSRIEERDEDSNLSQSTQQQKGRRHGQERSIPPSMELSVVGENSVTGQSTTDDDQDSSKKRSSNSLSFVVTTPARPQTCPAVKDVDAAPVISQYVGTFSLSPLSEFTIHHPGDDSNPFPLEASYVVGDHHLVTGVAKPRAESSKHVLSMHTRDLVDRLAEEEPFEPYWEDMRDLVVHGRGKRLSSLHSLDEFCSRLETLDASGNAIRSLDGIPASVRQLRMTHNQLTGLTAWNHLVNLQYVDVSDNGLTSLGPLKSLVHLRGLRADNNRLTTLDGLKFHDALQQLRARGNNIECLDFDGTRLMRLTDLDLKDNNIGRVVGLEQLSSLSSLDLEGNQLESFVVGEVMDKAIDDKALIDVSSKGKTRKLDSLRYLRLDDNRISYLDVRGLPHLRLLHADRNRLVRVAGLSCARRIDSLSLREQRGDRPLDVPNLLARAYEVRKLYLSGNLIGSTNSTTAGESSSNAGKKGSSSFPSIPVDLLNLQLLEAANCGLRHLPEDLGVSLPNLRVLNLNFNALSDLSALRGIPRLKRLSVAGNRLTDPAALVCGCLAFFPMLAAVDMRDNPVTMGFYAPAGVMVGAQKKNAKTNEPRRSTIDAPENGQTKLNAELGASKGECVIAEKLGGDREAPAAASADGAETTAPDPFTLPDQDPERDETYVGRLDLETRMRRRVFEQVIVDVCRRLRKLDGLRLGRCHGATPAAANSAPQTTAATPGPPSAGVPPSASAGTGMPAGGGSTNGADGRGTVTSVGSGSTVCGSGSTGSGNGGAGARRHSHHHHAGSFGQVRRDAVWEAMAARGLVRAEGQEDGGEGRNLHGITAAAAAAAAADSAPVHEQPQPQHQHQHQQQQQQQQRPTVESSEIWPAENSFA